MEKLLAAVNKTKATGFKDDNTDKYWKVEGDQAGNGYAIIRFLPGKTDDDVPFIKTYSHGFKNDSGRWFIEQCPTSLGNNCPVCDSNAPLWNSGIESDKDIVRQRKRKTAYISNILVVSDPKNPDNEGKTFVFKYGQKIFDKVVGALTPEFDDEKAMNPFDLEEGANFKLKMRRVEGYANFDKSEFDAPKAVKNKDVVMGGIHDLYKLHTYKSYDELQTKFNLILFNNGTKKAVEKDDEEFVRDAVKKPANKAAPVADEEDDDLAYFSKLAAED